MNERKYRAEPEGSNGGGDWLTTYSDLVTLLLCFFVLLFSFSEPDAEKFRQMSESLKAGFDGGDGVLDGSTSTPEIPITAVEELFVEDDELGSLYSQLKNYSEEHDIDDEISVEVEKRGIVVRFKDNVLFDSGSAEIRQESKQIINAAIKILNQKEFQDRQIKVEGHTDSDPIVHSNNYPTNWELSSARATNVLRFLVEDGGMDPARVSSSGYSQYRPLEENDTPENKAKNRRVDIVVLTDDYENLEPGSETE